MSSVPFASVWSTTDMTPGNYTATPNSAEPPAAQVFIVNRGILGQIVSLKSVVTAPATATVTATFWIYDYAVRLWVPWASAVLTTYGTAQTVDVPDGAKVYVQISAVANAPTGFVVGSVFKP